MSEKHARQVWHAQSKSRVLHALIGNFSTLSLLHTYSTRPLAPSPFTSIRILQWALHRSWTTSSTASLKMPIPLARSLDEMFSGGMNRIVSYTDVVSRSIPFSRHRFATFEARFAGVSFLTAGSYVECEGEANSTATIRPSPRTSRICCPTVESAFSAFNAWNSSADLNTGK